jgi:hypothetical protein
MTKSTFGLAGALTILGFSVAITAPAAAQTLLFDRGLPTANLNNSAGSDRSNVAWAEGATGEVPPDTVSMGDNFTLSTGSILDAITVWIVDPAGTPSASSYDLWLGPDASPGAGSNAAVAEVTSGSSITQVTYAGGLDYQNTDGSYSDIYQLDFSLPDLDLDEGTYAFGVSGPAGATEDGVTVITPYLSASNGPLSGSTPMDDYNYVYGFDSTGAMDTANGYPFNSNGDGWDKSSDVNVQVYGEVPEPASLAILSVGIFALGAIRRRRRV